MTQVAPRSNQLDAIAMPTITHDQRPSGIVWPMEKASHERYDSSGRVSAQRPSQSLTATQAASRSPGGLGGGTSRDHSKMEDSAA